MSDGTEMTIVDFALCEHARKGGVDGFLKPPKEPGGRWDVRDIPKGADEEIWEMWDTALEIARERNAANHP